jgi:hypothetical protein
MKKSNFLKVATVIAVMTITAGTMWAQAPASVSAESTTLVKDSTNSAGVYKTSEYIDSLTVGAVNVKYLVYPDLKISPSYAFSTSATANLNSTFVWSSSPSTTTINNTVSGFATNYAKITFPATAGDYTISVVETATTGTCAGTAQTLAARLIAAPVVTGGTVTGTISCPTTVTPYNMNVPNITLSGLSSAVVASQQIKIDYTLTGPVDNAGTSGTIGSGTITLAEGSSVPDLSTLNGNVDYPGTYTFTITGISDRISRKSAVSVTPTFTAVTFVINRRPVTGPIYHVPNM